MNHEIVVAEIITARIQRIWEGNVFTPVFLFTGGEYPIAQVQLWGEGYPWSRSGWRGTPWSRSRWVCPLPSSPSLARTSTGLGGTPRQDQNRTKGYLPVEAWPGFDLLCHGWCSSCSLTGGLSCHYCGCIHFCSRTSRIASLFLFSDVLTTRIRKMGESNLLACVCLSVHREGVLTFQLTGDLPYSWWGGYLPYNWREGSYIR